MSVGPARSCGEADDKIWLAGRTPSGRQQSNDLAHVTSQMHTTPLQITKDGVVSAKDIVKIGSGVDKSSFITGASAAEHIRALLSLTWYSCDTLTCCDALQLTVERSNGTLSLEFTKWKSSAVYK